MNVFTAKKWTLFPLHSMVAKNAFPKRHFKNLPSGRLDALAAESGKPWKNPSILEFRERKQLSLLGCVSEGFLLHPTNVNYQSPLNHRHLGTLLTFSNSFGGPSCKVYTSQAIRRIPCLSNHDFIVYVTGGLFSDIHLTPQKWLKKLGDVWTVSFQDGAN